MNLHILIVDDDACVVKALRRTILMERPDWEVSSAYNAEEALEAMDEAPADVVLSDVRMPGMDGAELLTIIRDKYPASVRILLSGHSDRETSLRAIGPAHQFLSKPCDTSLALEMIERSARLRETLHASHLKRLVASVKSLPSPPQHYFELIDEIGKPDVAILTISKIVERDMGMVAKILQLVNSSFFGVGKPINSVSEAITYLGLETLKSVVALAEVFSHVSKRRLGGFSVDDMEMHGLAVGTLAKRIAIAEGAPPRIAESSLLAGLLHDCGHLILTEALPFQYRRSEKTPTPDLAEQAPEGQGHAEVGAYLLALWGLSDEIVEAAAYHHREEMVSYVRFSPLTAVRIADRIVEGQAADVSGIEKWESWSKLAA